MNELARLTFILPANHSTEQADALSGLLALYVPHGWQEESARNGELHAIVHSPSPQFCAELSQNVSAVLPDVQVRHENVADQNWMEAWKEFFTPVEAGSRFLVLAPWMEAERAATDRTVILIEPKTAFGTGHHATTALCLEAVSALHEQERLRSGMRFLDLGTGSGILGIGCAKLGLSGEGWDIDQAAVDNSCENRELNTVAEQDFQVARGSISDVAGTFDIILANILAGPLVDMAPAITALRASDGAVPLLVLSGILDIQADMVITAYAKEGRTLEQRIARGEWVCLLFR